MNIFSEIYGTYYRIAAKILEEGSISPARLSSIIQKYGFRDSVLFLPQKLDPRSGESWGLLRDDKGVFRAVTKNLPPKIITTLQKRWIRAMLDDPRVCLFMSDDTISRLTERLSGVQPLYRREHFYTADRFSDGDDYSSLEYRTIFRTVLSSVRTNEILDITFRSGKGTIRRLWLVPIKIEYSHKNDKFRLYAIRVKKGSLSEGCVVNIGRIIKAEKTGNICNREISYENSRCFRRCAEPVEVHISRERNAMERFLMEFASYEKQTWLDDDEKGCTVRLWYDQKDEAELLIRLLSYGAVLEILSPEDMRHKAAVRVHKQYQLLYGKE